MKNLVLGIVLVAITSSVLGQDRTNRAKLSFTSQSEIIAKAIGWAYNDELGEWVNYQNIISTDKKNAKVIKGTIAQSFSSMQFKTVFLDSVTYYVLVLRRMGGAFQYPNIGSGYYQWKQTFGFIFTKEEYAKLASSSDSIVELKAQRMVCMCSNYERYNEVKFLDLVRTELESEHGKYRSTYTFPIKKVTVKGENLVRFFIPERYPSSADYNFEKRYFEVTQTAFNKLLIK